MTCSGATFSWPEMWYCTSSLKNGRFMVGQQIVKADTAADEDLFDPRELPQLSQQLEIVTCDRPADFCRGRGTGTARAGRRRGVSCFSTGGLAEIGRRAADIVDIALEVRIFRHVAAASARMDSWLRVWTMRPWWKVRAQKRAAAEAAPVGDQAEFDLLQRPGRPLIFHSWGDSSGSRAGRRRRPSPAVDRGFCGGFCTT